MDDIYRFVCFVFRVRKFLYTKQIQNFHEFFNQSDTFDAKNSYREICQNLGGQLIAHSAHSSPNYVPEWLGKRCFCKDKIVPSESSKGKNEVCNSWSMTLFLVKISLPKHSGRISLLTSQFLPLKVSKSQKHFFLKLHCPKNERNIRQNSAQESKKWLN